MYFAAATTKTLAVRALRMPHSARSMSSVLASKNTPFQFSSSPTTAAIGISSPILSHDATRSCSLLAPATASSSSASKRGPAVQGSGIGSDKEMIAANHRDGIQLLHGTRFYSTTAQPCMSQGAMKDEYGAMDDSGHTYVYDGDYELECGALLPSAQLRYQTYGELNKARDNVVVVCHALTGNASLHAWWGGLLGPGRAFDTDKYFVVCANILGSCYGSTSPVSINPATGRPYGKNFPDISVKDTVRLQLLMLKEDLGVSSIQSVIGGSFGGMQAMEFAAQAGSSEMGEFFSDSGQPLMRSVIPIACGAAHSAWQIGVSEVQRQAIYKDPHWNTNRPENATAGLQVARQLGMISYRTAMGYQGKFARAKQTKDSPPYGSKANWKVKSYLEYQGTKFLDRFDPVTYVKMTEQMDSHDLSRGRASKVESVLESIDIPALVLGIDSDVLYPLYEQEFVATHMPAARLEIIHSADGHDGFLLEQEQVGNHIAGFLKRFD